MTCCVRTQQCLPLAVIFNIPLVFAMTWVLAKGYFINNGIEAPLEYESRSIHIVRITILMFASFYFSFIGCLLCALVAALLEMKENS